MSQEYREGQLVLAHCCLGSRGWKSLAMKNGKDGGVAHRPRRLEGWRSMKACAKCKDIVKLQGQDLCNSRHSQM